MYDYNMMGGNDGVYSFGMQLFWLIFLFVGVLFIVHFLRGHQNENHKKISPIDIARERYAKGEITKDQFDELKKELK